MPDEIILPVFIQKIKLFGLRKYFPDFMSFISKSADYCPDLNILC